LQYLAHNRFFYAGISKDISRLKSLVRIDLSNNQLECFPPFSFKERKPLPIFFSLIFFFFLFQREIPAEFSQLHSLKHLELSENDFKVKLLQ